MAERKKDGHRTMPLTTTNFRRVQLEKISFTREGKHHQLLLKVFADLGSLPKGEAIAIPKEALQTKFENVRAAIKALCRKEKIRIKTGSDLKHFYVWKV
jgi:hypothetical protein